VNPFAIIARLTQLRNFMHYFIMCMSFRKNYAIRTILLEVTIANAQFTLIL